MAKKPYSNTTDKIQHIGNVTLWPGDTREVEETFLPGYKTAESAPDAPQDSDLLAFLDRSIKDIVPIIQSYDEAGNPIVADADLAKLKAAEEAGKTRSSLMKVFAEEELRRANEVAELRELEAQIMNMDNAQLRTHRELVQDKPRLLYRIDTELKERADQYTVTLQAMSDDQLLEQLDIKKDDPDALAVVNQVIDNRKVPAG